MIVIATGPRSNGTSLLYRIIATGGGKTPLHLPAYPPEFREQDWATDFPTALFVVILRDAKIAALSLVQRGLHKTYRQARREQTVARDFVFGLPFDRTLYVIYDNLVAQPAATVADLDRRIRLHGYTGAPLSLPEPIVDGNAKYLEAA